MKNLKQIKMDKIVKNQDRKSKNNPNSIYTRKIIGTKRNRNLWLYNSKTVF